MRPPDRGAQLLAREDLHQPKRDLLNIVQDVTRSFRAKATIVPFFPRPPSRFARSRNHRLSADAGWFRSHSQASWTMVDRSLGLPDLDTPCSCRTDPLCHGVGANPA